MEQAGVESVVDLSQITITIMLISLDSNIGQSYVSTVLGGNAQAAATRRLLSRPPAKPPPKRHISRMLLQLNSPVNPDPDEPEPAKNSAPTTTQEITSVHDNAMDILINALSNIHELYCSSLHVCLLFHFQMV